MDSPSNRYSRQTRFDPIGDRGQAFIRRSTVAVIGCGALGTVAAEILVRSGVGQMRLIDRDVVEWSNLQRQALFTQQDATDGRAKAAAAADHLRAINSDVEIEVKVADVTAANISGLLDGVDVVVDGTDNFQVRFLINDWSLETQTPWVHGGCVGASGQVRLFDGQGQPCFRCLVPQPPPADAIETCDTAGVVGSATHVIASLQAMEATKWLSGNHQAVRKEMWSIDLWNNQSRVVSLPKSLSKSCPACLSGKRDFLSGQMGTVDGDATVLCGRDAVQLSPLSTSRIDLSKLARRWDQVAVVNQTPFFVRIELDDQHQTVSENVTMTLFRDGRVVVDGTSDPSLARTIRDRLLGN